MLTASEIPPTPTPVSPCFTRDTLIRTLRGDLTVQELEPGDLVQTRDRGYRPVRWIGQRHLNGVTLERIPDLNPVRIKAGALGLGLPLRDLVVSPQHRVMISNSRTREWFGTEEVLAAAIHMTIFEGVAQEPAPNGITYFHILFDEHELVASEGTWTESFQPDSANLDALGQDQRAEILELFPQLAPSRGRSGFAPARRAMSLSEVRESSGR